jgi:hypothetical protein
LEIATQTPWSATNPTLCPKTVFRKPAPPLLLSDQRPPVLLQVKEERMDTLTNTRFFNENKKA